MARLQSCHKCFVSEKSPTCHSERSEESWLGFNPADSDENIRKRTP